MRAIAIVGFKKSGKTTLVLALVQALKKRGLSVAAAKCSESGFDEPETTDTARYKKTADAVLGLSDHECYVSWPGRRMLADLAPLVLAGERGADVLVMEGCKDVENLPRIVLAKNAEEAEALGRGLALAVTDQESADPEALADLIMEKGFLLPGFDCESCGREDCGALAREIVAGEATLEDCRTKSELISVRLNGRDMPMNPFTARIISSAIKAMLAELKGFGPGTVEITLDGGKA